ncbi:MAG TPA: SusC/RagA family TonB-linked outer membrane protein [Puia sp.]|uniref:SusC/RagA family TonB-linked outer membrane protein n=1 Tax=Puia sp. TaxID=2045100 RepID=UPI002B59B981|nr:SusC/RagA family TonB-linked outer membrane protein [Puia sp.]HVU95476.1 SusC/RagA family TonB-linked outer membrane protein [Puia sp.]
MKLTGILLVAAFLQVSAGSVAQRLSINVRNGSLEKIFAEIEKKTNYVFFYDASLLQKTKPVTVEMKDASVEDVLRITLKGQGLDFAIQDRTIFVKREVEKPVPVGAPAISARENDNGVITVIVQSEVGVPIVGATVVMMGVKRQGVTDADGRFLVKGVPDGEYRVEVTSIGYEKRVEVLRVMKGEALLAVRLKQAVNGLDEMVVKGYYNTTKRLNTGDVYTVKGEDIQKQPVSDPILALEGRVPGLVIQQASGMPGAYSVIRIRGQNSIANGNDPLYIIDGVPFSALSLSSSVTSISALGGGNANSNTNGSGVSPFNSLNPSDIESVEVLKDADATAIYGSRGANGVILITTRKGKTGGTRFDANVFTGAGMVAHKMKLLRTEQYLAMRREAFQNEGLPYPDINTDAGNMDFDINGVWDTTHYTDWQKVVFGNTAHFTNAQGTLSGGNSNTQFVLGGGYSKQGTVFPGSYSDQKAMGHFNLTHTSANHRLGATLTASYVDDNNNLPTADFTSYITNAPDAPPLLDKFGNINWEVFQGTPTFYSNTKALERQTANSATNNLIANLGIKYQLLPGLELRSELGYNHNEMNETGLNPSTSLAPPYNADPSFRRNTFANTTFSSWIIEPQISYQRPIGSGKLEMLVGSSFQENKTKSITQSASGFVSDDLISNPQAASNIYLLGANNILYRYTAVYGRIGFNWREKYLLNLTARRDGSSRFGPGKQFGNFGAVGTAWIFSKEKFIESLLPFLSFGKLRASYGTSGNDQILDYQFLSTYSTFSSTTYQGITGLAPTRLTNPFFAWEVLKKLEGGVEIGLLKDRIMLSVSYFRNRTGNQLVGLSLPYLSGFASIQYNLPAVLQNTGTEIVLNTVNIKSKDFEWASSINATMPNNKLVSFPNLANFAAYKNRYVIGQSLFIQKVYHNTGVDPQNGNYIFATKNASGVPSYPQDLIVSRPVTQRFYGGLQNRVSYKGFSLDFLLQYVDQTGYGYQHAFGLAPGSFNYNQPTAVLARWQGKGNLTGTQAFGTDYGTANSSYALFGASDGVFTNTSFLRLKNLQFSYDLPAGWRSKCHLQTARIYLQAQNLFTITRYVGLDPESSGNLSLPPIRMIAAGFQVGL